MDLEMTREYLRLITVERDWSWVLLAIAYFLAALSVRGIFLHAVKVRAKALPKKAYQRLKNIYLAHSILGWVLFIIPLVVLVGLWNREDLWPLLRREWALVAGAGVSFILSLMAHFSALAIAAIETLRKMSEGESAS